MDEKLQNAYDALQAAHDAGNTADATQIADYIDTLKAQQSSATAQADQPRTSAVLPALGGGLGAVTGAGVVGASKGVELVRALDRFGGNQQQTTGYNPRGSSVEESIQNWRTYADAQNEAAKSVRRDTALQKKYPGFTRPNLPHLQPTVPTAAENIFGHAANIGTMKPITGLTAGANAIDLMQQVKAGNPIQSTISAAGLAGSAAPYIKALPKKYRGVGAAVSMAAPVVNRALDQFTNPPEQQYNTGGLVALAEGGQPPEMGEAQAYEPSYNERIYNAIAPYIGKDQARGLMGMQGADSYSQYNPLSWAAQAPGQIAQNAKDFVKSSKEGDYLGAMGNYLEGAWNAAPMMGKFVQLPERFLKNRLENLQWEKGTEALTPALEKAAPTIAKAIHFIGEHLPKHESVLAGSKLSPPLYNKKNISVEGYDKGGKVIKKFTEAIIPHEGKTLLATLADRTKATEGFSGGPGFINLHPDYTWAVDAPGVVTKHMNVVNRFGGPDQTVFAPMLMSTEAHKSNRPVFHQIYNDLQEKIKSGEFTPEQIDKLNQRILAEKGVDLSKSPGVQSPDFLQFADTFNRRGKVADILGLKKTGGVDLQQHLESTIDPVLKEAETGAIGPQLFTMEGSIEKPEIHPAYSHLFLGEKGADQFTPVPREFLFRDLEKQAMEQMGRPMTDYNYRNVQNLQGGLPNQLIDDKLIKSLQDLGYKKGGKIKKKK